MVIQDVLAQLDTATGPIVKVYSAVNILK